MQIILLAIAIMVLGGVLSLLNGRWSKLATALGSGGTVAGCAVGFIASIKFLLGAPQENIHLAWDVPYGSFSVGIDALSALFLVPIFVLTALAAIYGPAYLRAHDRGLRNGISWFFFSILAASMTMVVVARNGLLFLVAWELMTLASFFLVTMDDEKESVREAGWTYLIATHIGTAFLLALFVLLSRGSGSLDFATWGGPQSSADILFLLAVIGFGTKAGFMPMHIWLPKAHPAAPSHVSAVMSGVMIKTGIYGLIRVLIYLGPPPAWWGTLLIIVGAISGILGVAYALSQHGIKSLLAYHSVENIGIIALGLGLGILGASDGNGVVAALGFGGALLHVVNHAAFKGLLFLCAGAVIKATGQDSIDSQGGLLKRMPRTGASFLVGAAAISGLLPLNGFVSEFMIYLGSFAYLGALGGSSNAGPWSSLPAVIVIASLALIGGLAAACFTKAFGIIFLGEPRSKGAAEAREVPAAMRAPMFMLAASCAAIGLLAPYVVRLLSGAIGTATGMGATEIGLSLEVAAGPLTYIAIIGSALIAAVILVAYIRKLLLSGRENRRAPTWDCGYAAPTARMQYTASSYADPIVRMFGPLVCGKKSHHKPEGFFPRSAWFESHPSDLFGDAILRPLFGRAASGLSWFRWLQHGNVNIYVLYVAVTLLILLAWKIGGL